MIVVLVLANIGSLSTFQVFMLCFSVLMPALLCQFLLMKVVQREALTGANQNKGGFDALPLVEKQPATP